MKRKIKISFQIIVVVLILTLLAMLVTGCMIMFKGIGAKGTFTYMIVLGNKIEGSEPSPLLADRIETAAKYMEQNPHVIAIVSGGQGPSKFDCSGLVYYVYKHFGYTLKPGAKNQWSLLDERVSKSELLPGDLLFFSSNGRSGGIFHVGIYIGDGQFVHAANSRKGVIVTDMDEDWYANRYLGAKRPF